ncbi:hypothetical protein RN001_015243 [Aquatica leii]|uniref:Peptidase A2 domain-containing protein n=1 Tax=Aquatica leii TaxID=1421715 RepID=A0AAN7PPE5_9COLE|nr:hypothetical protein RN001_015243 [Aquatica leii]
MAQSYTHGPLKLPQDFDLQGQNYLIATGQHESNASVKLAILRNIIGNESARIMCTIVIPDGTADPYKYMMDQLEAYVNPRVNEVFKRYTFLSKIQKEGESFEHFLTDIKHLVKDKIVMGIRNTVTREALLRIDKLTLNKVIEVCRTSEMSRNQNKIFSEEAEVNLATKKYKKKSDKSEEGNFKCRRCRSMHRARCGILNHFAVACRVKNLKSVHQKDNSDSDDSNQLSINNVNFTGSPKEFWDEIVEIENVKFKVKLDTGADISVIPSRIFNKVNKQFKGTQAKSIGTVNLLCKHKNKIVYEDFVIVEGVNKILLSGQEVVNLQEYDKNVGKDKFISKYSKVFSGSGRFKEKYKIVTVDNVKPVSYPPYKTWRLVQREAIVKVEEMDPRASINRIVIEEKSNGKLRIYLDPQDLNSQIIRKPQPVKSIEEMCSKMVGKKYFPSSI